jgi:two-component sensor histidine kinase
VLDDGPGLPDGFQPSGHKGLGMKIIQSLVKQIGGELQIGRGDHDRGASFTVMFNIQPLVNGVSIADKRSVEQAMKIAAE